MNVYIGLTYISYRNNTFQPKGKGTVKAHKSNTAKIEIEQNTKFVHNILLFDFTRFALG